LDTDRVAPSSLLRLLLSPRPPRSTLFPYTTLFRSQLSTRRTWPCGKHSLALRQQCRQYPNRRPVRYWSSQPYARDAASPRRRVRSEEHSLNSSHVKISYAVFCLKKKKNKYTTTEHT